MSKDILMRELTDAEVTTIAGGTTGENPWFTPRFEHFQFQEVHAEVRAQMAKLVKELQESVRCS